MIKRWFVTGTDTEVGKTVASSALLQAANSAGYRTAGYKPVASGSDMTAEGLRNGDALALQANSAVALSYEEVNPYVFAEPTSPHIVSADEGRPIELARLSAGLRHLEQRADWVLIEGAGGWFTPLSGQHTFADWVQREQLPVILVVGIKLGCINHAVLTAQAIQQAGLSLVGWVANDVSAPGLRHQEYLTTLRRMLPAPLLGEIPHLAEPERQALGHYLDLSVL
ncbi:ATP-dependent dethiobiotin synthetase BioD 1 [Serratia proteamaculans]|uniref:ATP-dependent dethiobiotin synthetase BioD n=1 Tax=Serratia proteamaculans TaxID=28151 RepID=A0ABS0TL09_SERPR|nr:dethiobiotin synthase [Serratia proteamaculans]KAB1496737.1 ATP-dependent dethiobiotin synthetase BioD [Serratia proteamaculans]MBI6179020.1 ATP-dependent dethiobiotin synthetase BioD [Serratia proteamaculans]RYM51724.1 dethiobiotin synthase [Serratia proteamaculans]CAI0764964.1 ATP-dependent dethiobiotin synthetase BioD 1 [Serratia proteamaculans]CAI0925385.1 ATP-dependent dethiobiotin synthetase BioD 1 [Serratia proteamaculans]